MTVAPPLGGCQPMFRSYSFCATWSCCPRQGITPCPREAWICRNWAVSGVGPFIPHVWTAPSWQELFSRVQHWSVRPCVRPFSAVHMTAGHNGLRGSGPDQQLAFKNAMAHVGCPDRRIDRLCITCCSPSQPSRRASCPARFRSSRKREGFLVSLAPCHHGPDHSGDLVGERDSRNLGRPPCQQSREPRPMCGAMNLGVTDDSERAGHEQ